MAEREKKIVIFGAGKIGRSFIGQLFSKGGYHVIFVDISKEIISEINAKKEYSVIIKGEKDRVIQVNNISGIHLEKKDEIIASISKADVIAVSVGLRGLKAICPLLSEAISYKIHQFPLKQTDLIEIITIEC